MDERQTPPLWLMMLPLLGLAGLVAYQYFVPPTPAPEPSVAAQADPTQAVEAAAPPTAEEAGTAPVAAAVDAQSRAASQKTLRSRKRPHQVASFTNLNTAMVSLAGQRRSLPRRGRRTRTSSSPPTRSGTWPLAPEFSGVSDPRRRPLDAVGVLKRAPPFRVGRRRRDRHPHLGARRPAISSSLRRSRCATTASTGGPLDTL